MNLGGTMHLYGKQPFNNRIIGIFPCIRSRWSLSSVSAVLKGPTLSDFFVCVGSRLSKASEVAVFQCLQV